MSISSNFLGKERDQAFSPQAKRWSRVREQREFCQLHPGGENKVAASVLAAPQASPTTGSRRAGQSQASIPWNFKDRGEQALPSCCLARCSCCLRGISLKSRRKPADLTPSFTSYQRTCKLTLFRATLNFRQGERKNKNQQA